MPSGLRRLAWSVAGMSVAALAYQLLLMRWLAIAHWHPFAVVIISLALLGHGASGSVLAVLGARAVRRFDALFPIAGLAFAAGTIACTWLASTIPFDGLELAWDPRQVAWLAALYVCLSLPFFFAASCFGLAFARFGHAIPMLYGADLLGAGAGALLALALVSVLPVEVAIACVSTLAALAACLSADGARARIACVAAAIVIAGVAFARPPLPPLNPFKSLAKAMLVPEARIVATRQGAYGWIAVVESPRVPLRHAPGLSLSNMQEPAAQLGVFVDGALAGVIVDRRDPNALAYLHRTTASLPYVLRPHARVLVLGAGTGSEVTQALAMQARSVEAVERNARLLRLVRAQGATFARGLYDDPRVRTLVADPRAFVRAAHARYDVIVLAGGGSAAAGGAGVQAVAEDYALTVEALRDLHDRLAPLGVLAITRFEKQPPRDLPKLFATAVEALREAGVARPGASLVVIRNWDAWTLLLRRGAFTDAEIARLRAFADEQGFDLVYHRGLQAREANRFHVLARDEAFLGTRALLSSRATDYVRDYKFDIAPTHDDRPYFANFFKWATLPELWRLRAQGAAVLLDSGYLLLVAALVQAIPIAIVLVLLPLFALPRAGAQGVSRWRASTYFIALGVGFMFVEIACLARLQLLVGHPLLAIGAGLAGFLAFAGAGSLFAQRWLAHATQDTKTIPRLAMLSVLAIGIALAWHMASFAAALAATPGWPPALRALASLVTIAPLAFAMGLPFPLGLTRLAREAPAFVPWAWGLNGCASVLAAIGALLVALEAGLVATLAIALVVYAIGVSTWRAAGPSRQ